jgi:DNA-binding transcriptional MerR regulator
MRVGELSRRSGVSVPSIKYYLREGMLPPGERTGPNQADYGEGHLRRLGLVRALLDVGGLSVAATRDVLAAVDAPDVPLHHVLGAAQAGVTPAPEERDDEAAERARATLDDLLARRGWRVSPDNPARRTVVDVLTTYERLDEPELASAIEIYADALEGLARREVDTVLDRGERGRVVEGAVVGTVLGDRLIGALRRLAQEDASWRRIGSHREAEDAPAQEAPGA